MNKHNNDEEMLLSREERRKRKAVEKSKNARERTKIQVIQMNYFLTLTDNEHRSNQEREN
jgi:hypothetical protein